MLHGESPATTGYRGQAVIRAFPKSGRLKNIFPAGLWSDGAGTEHGYGEYDVAVADAIQSGRLNIYNPQSSGKGG
jgi:hypothetical protein